MFQHYALSSYALTCALLIVAELLPSSNRSRNPLIPAAGLTVTAQIRGEAEYTAHKATKSRERCSCLFLLCVCVCVCVCM